MKNKLLTKVSNIDDISLSVGVLQRKVLSGYSKGS